jgi:hypothetical protein
VFSRVGVPPQGSHRQQQYRRSGPAWTIDRMGVVRAAGNSVNGGMLKEVGRSGGQSDTVAGGITNHVDLKRSSG